jgi:hypothetical protein
VIARADYSVEKTLALAVPHRVLSGESETALGAVDAPPIEIELRPSHLPDQQIGYRHFERQLHALPTHSTT